MRAKVTGVASLLLLAGTLACGGPPERAASEVEAVWRDRLPEDPGDRSWSAAPVFTAEMIVQDLVEPRLIEPSTSRLAVQAATDGRRIAMRLSWEDPTVDDLPGASRFSDACAIQLPRRAEADVPAPQMGEEGRPVEITYWRASWQAVVDGRPDEIRAIHPGATVDHYPFEAPSLEPGSEEQRSLAALYAPARALDRAMEGPREHPVEDLLAAGPGTLATVAEQTSTGKGRRRADGWEVVIVRPLPEGLDPGGRSQVAFAVWEGSRDEVGSRKMRSVWIPLALAERG